ncbi:MAG TPA: phenylalanine--tRNA ligase subunit beta [Planctomycetota bacterium]|nr:phenylalanine--tRNA ligase subunit beta [Planctomycetota bacterium]
MKLPLPWLLDYLPADLRGKNFAVALLNACERWDLDPASSPPETLGKLCTFAGFNCDAVHGSGENAVLELDVLSNRPDGQCVLGLAREIAAILRVPLRAPSYAVNESGEPASSLAKVRVDEPELCPRYTARIIRGVKVGPSPQWLQDRLTSMGLQPRNNIVDVTNFVLFELNQPLHAFDLNGLAGREIIVRRAKDKEPFEPLYGAVPPLTSETLVIADAEKPRAIAGVIGGKGSEVTPATTEILLESAYFHPANTRRTVRRLKVMDGKGTDSSYRFERGIDLDNVANASARAAKLIVEVAGGTIAPGIIDVFPKPRAPKCVAVRMSFVKRVFGAEIPSAAAEKILTAIGCQVQCEGDTKIKATVPTWRRGDLEREIDLIEEVARLHGYNFVPETTAMSARVAPRSAREIASDRLRTLFTSLGYFECVTDSLIDPRWPAPAVWSKEKPLALDKSSVLREDHSALRNSLLASLLFVRKHNQDQRTGEARLFEIGNVFLKSAGPRPTEMPVLCIVDDRGFQALADTLTRVGEALELDGAHLKLARSAASPVAQASRLQVSPDFLCPAEACRVLRVRQMYGDERAEDALGWMGTLSPALQNAFDLRKAPAVCELDLAALAALPTGPRRYHPLPAFPEIARDIAMVVGESIAWSELESFARNWTEPLRDKNEQPRFLSVFRGKQVGAGKKSVAFSLVYRAPDRTLTDDEVNAAHKKFQDALLAKFNATLRA